MHLWRISNYADLSGEGGRRRAARWNSAGRPVVYLAEHPALALLEKLVHLEIDPGDLPDTYQLLRVELPNDISREEETEDSLTARNAGWRTDAAVTRAVGDEWLRRRESLLLWLPSVILPESRNALLNPAHPEASKAKIVRISQPPYDPRLLG